MARFCFYCGRELISGEKCNCRTAGGSTTQAQPAGDQESKSQPDRSSPKPKTGAKPRKSAFQSFFQAFNSSSGPGAAQPKAAAGSSRAKYTRPPVYNASSRPRANPITLQSVLVQLRVFAAYLSRPADSIKSAVQSGSRQRVLIILLVQGAFGGLFLLTASSKAILRAVLSLNVATSADGNSLLSSVFIFMQGFGINLAGSLLLVLIYQLALRYLFKQPTSFMRLLTSLSPAFLYFTIFMLLSLLSLPASIFSAAMTMLTGFIIAALAQYLAIRQISGFDENRSFLLLTFVMLIFTGILALLLNLSIPALSALLGQSVIV